jgi:hypothetical protein
MAKGDKAEARRLEEEARRLEDEARRLEDIAHRLENEAHKLEDRAHELEDRDRGSEGPGEGHGHGDHGHGHGDHGHGDHGHGDHGHGDHGHGDHGHGGGDEHGEHGGHEGPGGPKVVLLTVVVNGQPTDIEADRAELLSSVRARALQATDNVAQPPESWEFKDEAGVVLDTDKPVGEFGFGKQVTLFLSLRAGVAGA